MDHASPDLLELLRAEPDEDSSAPTTAAMQAKLRTARAHRHPAEHEPPAGPLVPKQGLTWEQSQAALAELDKIAKRAKAALTGIENGAAMTGASALGKVYNDARDAARWGRIHLEGRNPGVEFFE